MIVLMVVDDVLDQTWLVHKLLGGTSAKALMILRERKKENQTGQNAPNRGEREGKQEVVTHSLHSEGAGKEESGRTGWDQEGGVRVRQYQVVSSKEAGRTGERGVRGCRW